MTNEEARKIIGNRFLNGFFAALVKAMDALEQPEIIYCKDCVDYKDYEDMGFKFRLSDGQCRRYGCAVDKKDFCSHAVMEEE